MQGYKRTWGFGPAAPHGPHEIPGPVTIDHPQVKIGPKKGRLVKSTM